MGQKQISRCIKVLHQRLVGGIRPLEAKAYEVERNGSYDFKSRILAQPAKKLVCKLHMTSYHSSQSVNSIGANDTPELQRAKAPPKRNVPIAKVDHFATRRCCVSQILRSNRERLGEFPAVAHVKAGAIEVGEHPLVAIKTVAVGQFQPIMDVAEFPTKSSRPRMSRVHMQPDLVLTADRADLGQGIACECRSGTNRCTDEARNPTGTLVFRDRLRQGGRLHTKALINFNRT